MCWKVTGTRFDDSGPSGLSDWSAALAGERYMKSLRLMSTDNQGVAPEIRKIFRTGLGEPNEQLDEETKVAS